MDTHEEAPLGDLDTDERTTLVLHTRCLPTQCMDTHEEAPLGDLDTDERTGTDDDHTGDLDDEHTHDPRPIAVPTKQLGELGEFLINMVSVEPSLFKRKKKGGGGGGRYQYISTT